MSQLSTDHAGHIELIIGPMFAGKTTELMRRVRRELFARQSCYVIKHAHDVRYSCESVSSHDKLLLTATAAVSELRAVGDAWRGYDVVAVDEGQFFPDIVPFCSQAADAGKKVIVSALDGDYLRQPFDGIARLIPLAESVKKLSAVCMVCHSRAGAFTHRTIRSEQRELIGGADMYIATCRDCYNASEKGTTACEAKGGEAAVKGPESPEEQFPATTAAAAGKRPGNGENKEEEMARKKQRVEMQ